MYRFWESIIKPCFEIIDAKVIVEIGAQNGYQTKKLIEYAKDCGGLVMSIDPFPLFDYKALEKEYASNFKLYEDLSIPALPNLQSYDAILIDGDHNWYTVYTELNLVKKAGEKFPLVLLHDVSWPYARRDLYYNPDNIPKEHRLPYARKGLVYGQKELAEKGGINAHLFNAIDEGTPHNGVLTAVDDFIAENPNLSFYMLDCISGLGIICEKNVFDTIISHIESPDTLKKLIHATEEQRLKEFIGRSTVLNNYENLKEHYSKSGESHKREINKLSDTIKSYVTEIENLKADNAQLSQMLNSSKRWANELETSYRFRAGSEMFDALSSPKKMVKLPLSLVRLLRQYKRGNTAQTTAASVPAKPEKYIKPYHYGRDELIKYASDRLISKKVSLDFEPLVSIIIISRNGLENLKILFDSFANVSFYKNFEIIYVDNASTDKSIEFIEKQKSNYSITIIKNSENLSFSAANNIGAKSAKGEYLLFLNNDIEVTENWLDEMLLAAQSEKCGAVGAKLIYPIIPENTINKGKSYLVQHKGICFSDCDFDGAHFIRPYNMGNCDDPIDIHDNDVEERSVVTAACLLVSKSAFEEVGSFDESYIYGYEDVDLCLKLHRKGYRNYCSCTSILFHYEFGTQAGSEADNRAIVERRSNNIRVFRKKWQKYLINEILNDKLNNKKLFFESPLTIALVVTESTPDTSAGDFFTAMELGESLKKLGYNIKFLDRKSGDNWYDVGEDTDILISLLEAYDITKIRNSSPRLISIAWARNWFDRWCDKPYINDYSMIFASSKTACDFMSRALGKPVSLFPIATNSDRFADIPDIPSLGKKFDSDYVFTGSYWNQNREIMDILNPQDSNYKFKIFGANWEQTEKFKKYTGGFVSYKDIPQVYKHTKIVIDDANHATKPYGAVNSRVFDAIAAGKLVFTNGVIGAEETFEGLIPSFETSDDLKSLLNHYMTDQNAYNKKVEELREFVLNNHTYDIRARKLKEILFKKTSLNDKKIAILAPVPKWEERNAWGDYHFAVAMKKCFVKRGYEAEIRILPQWDNDFDGKYIIVLRGLSIYQPKAEHINIMWNISHPDAIPISEYERYDAVYISSEKWASEIRRKANTRVETLLQCSDTDVFLPYDGEDSEKYSSEILFVGNSRKIFRKIIKDILPSEYDLSVYGSNWEDLIDKKYIKGKSIQNSDLYKYYSNSRILLNDHWDDMREKGFISNRLFDGIAAGAFIISDDMPEIHDVFKGSIVTYTDSDDLREKVKFYMENPDEREKITKAGHKLVAENHTFEHRMDIIIKHLSELD